MVDLYARRADGLRQRLPVRRWFGASDMTVDERRGDEELIGGCDGPTIDLACGRGRLVSQLVRRGVCALGVDVSPVAVAATRLGGALAIQRDVFGRLPGAGRWDYAILADGNLGIGGDPVRMLARTRDLLGPGGVAIVEFGVRGTGFNTMAIRLETRTERGPWIPWAQAGVEMAAELGASAGLRVLAESEVAGRHIVRLAAQ